MEETKEMKEQKITIIRATYIWQESILKKKIKIIQYLDDKINIPLSTIIKNNKEYILKPYQISKDPFRTDNSLLVWCDMITTDGNIYNINKRHQIEKQEKEPCFALNLNVLITKKDNIIEDIIELLVSLCLKSNVAIDEYQIIGNKEIVIQLSFKPMMEACHDINMIKFIIQQISNKLNFEYEYQKSNYKFTDKSNEIDIYCEKLNNVSIPESVKKMDKQYLTGIYNDPYELIFDIIQSIY